MIKIHIDNIKNEDGAVWAVQDGKKYHRVHGIIVVNMDLYTRTALRQPRAYLYGDGKVQLVKDGERIIAVVTK